MNFILVFFFVLLQFNEGLSASGGCDKFDVSSPAEVKLNKAPRDGQIKENTIASIKCNDVTISQKKCYRKSIYTPSGRKYFYEWRELVEKCTDKECFKYSSVSKSFYKYFADKTAGGEQAEKLCKLTCAHLVSIHSRDERNLLRKLSRYRNFWIGLQNVGDAKASNRWFDGSGVGYRNFAPDSPQGPAGSCYIVQGRNGLWKEEECTKEYGRMCKIDIGGSTRPVYIATTPVPTVVRFTTPDASEIETPDPFEIGTETDDPFIVVTDDPFGSPDSGTCACGSDDLLETADAFLQQLEDLTADSEDGDGTCPCSDVSKLMQMIDTIKGQLNQLGPTMASRSMRSHKSMSGCNKFSVASPAELTFTGAQTDGTVKIGGKALLKCKGLNMGEVICNKSMKWENICKGIFCFTMFDGKSGGFYKFFSQPSPGGLMAEQRCLPLCNAHLTSIHTSDENKFLSSLSGEKPFWIGLENSTKWFDGSKVGYTNFEKGKTSSGQCHMYDRNQSWKSGSCDGQDLDRICKFIIHYDK